MTGKQFKKWLAKKFFRREIDDQAHELAGVDRPRVWLGFAEGGRVYRNQITPPIVIRNDGPATAYWVKCGFPLLTNGNDKYRVTMKSERVIPSKWGMRAQYAQFVAWHQVRITPEYGELRRWYGPVNSCTDVPGAPGPGQPYHDLLSMIFHVEWEEMFDEWTRGWPNEGLDHGDRKCVEKAADELRVRAGVRTSVEHRKDRWLVAEFDVVYFDYRGRRFVTPHTIHCDRKKGELVMSVREEGRT